MAQNSHLNKQNGSELLNMAAMSSFRHIAWPTGVHDKTLKVVKYTATMTYVKWQKPDFSIFFFFKQPSTKLVQVFAFIFVPKGFLFLWAMPLLTESL